VSNSFNPLARQRGCATLSMVLLLPLCYWVSILLRGNGVAQQEIAIEQARESKFQSSCEATGLRNTLTLRTPPSAISPFQSSCEATGLRNTRFQGGNRNDTRLSILLRGNGVAQRALWQHVAWRFSCCFNPLARQRGCATMKSLFDCICIMAFQSSCEATGLRNATKLSVKSTIPLMFQSSCEATGLRN